MKTRDEIIHTIGAIEANLNQSRETVAQLGQLKSNVPFSLDWEVNRLNNSLSRIQELLDHILNES